MDNADALDEQLEIQSEGAGLCGAELRPAGLASQLTLIFTPVLVCYNCETSN